MNEVNLPYDFPNEDYEKESIYKQSLPGVVQRLKREANSLTKLIAQYERELAETNRSIARIESLV